jgi:hypothetical protein
MSGKMTLLDVVATVFVLVGALNWGLVAFGWNAVEALFGTGAFTTFLYGLVGASGLFSGYRLLFR